MTGWWLQYQRCVKKCLILDIVVDTRTYFNTCVDLS